MSTFEEFEKRWEETSPSLSGHEYDRAAMEKIVRERTRKHKNVAMRYFWASFVLQLIVYSLLSHVILRYGTDTRTLLMCITGILIFIPFTVVLLQKYKAMATNKPEKSESSDQVMNSLYDYVLRQYNLLKSFYRFKRRYEIILIPISSAIGTFLVFHLYFPGGFQANQTGALYVFVITMVSCLYAIYRENKSSFREPLDGLQQVLNDFK